MSVYATIFGAFKYSSREAFDAAVQILQTGGWLNSDGFWVNELKEVSENQALDQAGLTILIARNHYRNLLNHLDALVKGAVANGKWASNDGMLSGGLLGNSKSISLAQWAKDQGDPEPTKDEFDSEDEYWENHQIWENEIIDAFLDS